MVDVRYVPISNERRNKKKLSCIRYGCRTTKSFPWRTNLIDPMAANGCRRTQLSFIFQNIRNWSNEPAITKITRSRCSVGMCQCVSCHVTLSRFCTHIQATQARFIFKIGLAISAAVPWPRHTQIIIFTIRSRISLCERRKAKSVQSIFCLYSSLQPRSCRPVLLHSVHLITLRGATVFSSNFLESEIIGNKFNRNKNPWEMPRAAFDRTENNSRNAYNANAAPLYPLQCCHKSDKSHAPFTLSTYQRLRKALLGE